MRKNIIRLYIILFVVLFILPGLMYNVWESHLGVENYEQRQLAEKPELNSETLRNYPELFENYFADNLPFRTQMITAHSWIKYFIFNQSPVDKVIIGEDGWLFYNPDGKDGDSLADYYCKDLYTEEELETIVGNLQNIKENLERHGREFVVFIAPNKETVYGSLYFPEYYPRNSGVTKADQVVDYLKKETDIRVVYPKNVFDIMMDNYSQYTYYGELGTHWNQLGAYIGTRELLKELNISVPDIDDLEIENAEGTDRGLAEMMSLSSFLRDDTEYKISGYTDNIIEVQDDTFDQSKYISTSKETRRLLIVGDSFGRWMAPYLASQFSNTYQFHRQYYNVKVLEEQDSDIVVLEVVERYMNELSNFKIQ